MLFPFQQLFSGVGKSTRLFIYREKYFQYNNQRFNTIRYIKTNSGTSDKYGLFDENMSQHISLLPNKLHSRVGKLGRKQRSGSSDNVAVN